MLPRMEAAEAEERPEAVVLLSEAEAEAPANAEFVNKATDPRPFEDVLFGTSGGISSSSSSSISSSSSSSRPLSTRCRG
jgi:hypothetical protein